MPAIGSVRIPEPFLRRGVLKNEARGDALYEGPLRFGWRPRIALCGLARVSPASVSMASIAFAFVFESVFLQRRVSVFTQTRPLQVENRGFRGRVRRSVGGAVGGDAQAGAISRQGIAISL
jgi:hypothetical protein